jgi:transcriptional regulator with XRE-family HTH domain
MLDLSLPLLIKTRREEKNLSIEDLSELIGYHPDVVDAIENNRKDVVICLNVLKEIAKELDIPLKVLLEKV